MDSSTWIAVFVPIFIVLFVVLPQEESVRKIIAKKKKKKKGMIIMTNELLKKYIGRKCLLSTGSLGTSIIGEIIEVNENWVEVETKKGTELVNSEFLQRIKVEKH